MAELPAGSRRERACASPDIFGHQTIRARRFSAQARCSRKRERRAAVAAPLLNVNALNPVAYVLDDVDFFLWQILVDG